MDKYMSGGRKSKRNRGKEKVEEEKPAVKTFLATEVMAVRIILELGKIWVLFSP